MVRRLPVLLFLSSMLLPAALGAQAFEGTLRARTLKLDVTPLLEQYGNDPDRLIAAPLERVLAAARDAGVEIVEDTGVYYVKGSRFRIGGGDLAPNAYLVTDVKTGAGFLVQPAERTYMEWTPEEAQRTRDENRAVEREPGEPTPAEFEPLGTTHEVTGRRCAEFQMTDEQTTTVACITTDLAQLTSLFRLWGETSATADEPGGNDLVRLTRHGFPLRIRELSVGGDEETPSATYEISEFTSIERGAVPESLFTPPAGFKKAALPGSP